MGACLSQGNSNPTLHVAQSPSTSWIVDSSASDHIAGDRSLFSSYTPCLGSQIVRIANGSHSRVVGMGTIYLSSTLTLY